MKQVKQKVKQRSKGVYVEKHTNLFHCFTCFTSFDVRIGLTHRSTTTHTLRASLTTTYRRLVKQVKQGWFFVCFC